ncbi:MAG: hypothetical protein RL088_3418 [Verrucomicrobiota bacterium]|jgi:REP element-mobilizing transposase RayT
MNSADFNLVPHPWATVGRGVGGAYRWLDYREPIARAWGRNLPHWRQEGCVYFVTFRTDDSIPQEVLRSWNDERANWDVARSDSPDAEAEAAEFERHFSARKERFLDDGYGACLLKHPDVRRIVVDVLCSYDGRADGYALDAFVIMPNHFHALVAPSQARPLSKVVKDWKSISAHRINESLGRSGALWQAETWDHIVRSAEQMEKFRRYIEGNPAKLPQNV